MTGEAAHATFSAQDVGHLVHSALITQITNHNKHQCNHKAADSQTELQRQTKGIITGSGSSCLGWQPSAKRSHLRSLLGDALRLLLLARPRSSLLLLLLLRSLL